MEAVKFDAQEFQYLQQQIFPYYLIISRVLCALTVISYPMLIYAFWKKTLKMSKSFRCLATYTHTFGFLFSLTFLIFQPVYIPQLYIIYSTGLTASLSGKFTFASICMVVICITHSCHGLCLSVFYCYHMSLRKCNAWFSRPKKLVFIVVSSYFVVLSICIGHCFTLPSNDEIIDRLSRDYGIVADLAKSQPSIIAFSTNKNLFIFMIYTVIVITVFLGFCFFLFLDYLKYRSQQNQDLSIEILKTIQILRLNYRIRVLLAIFIQVFPGFLFFFFIFVKPIVEAAFICLTLLTAYPFLDIVVEVFSIKVYRNKLVSIFKSRKKFSVAFTNIVLPTKSSRGSLFEAHFL